MSLLGFLFVLLRYLAQIFDDEWSLVWQDEFNGTAIDTSKWSFEQGDGCHIHENMCGWGNGELQWYTNSSDNAFVRDGNLIIRVLKQSVHGKEYTSARMRTVHRGDWQYGKILVRAKMMRGHGLWPAIWMLPTHKVQGGWPISGEIDIAELRGSEPDKLHMTAHYGRLWNDKSYKTLVHQLKDGDFADRYHEYGVLWQPNKLDWLLDGKTMLTLTPNDTQPFYYPFNEAFHLLLNVAVGGNMGGQRIDNEVLPQEMAVDYVRVYQQRNTKDSS